MELIYNEEIPQMRLDKSGRYYFNKGYTPHNKGKKLEELYPPEKVKEMKAKMVRKATGETRIIPPHNNKEIICVIDNKEYYFQSIHDAARKTGLHISTISNYINNKRQPRNGWKWYQLKDYNNE